MMSLSLFLFISQAAFAASSAPGETQSSFDSPNGISESCSLPRSLDLAATRASNVNTYIPFQERDLNTSQKICRADFYDNRESTEAEPAVVTCPKLSSTNPGLILHALPFGMTREAFLRDECPKSGNRAGKTIAKFKQSISCSYTPAILSYPRVAEMMKSEIELPFTAYRSMDLQEHLKIATKAKEMAEHVGGAQSLIAQTWRTLYKSDLNPSTYGARLYRDDNTQIYGALVPETSGDEFYFEANGATRGDRVANFQVTKAFQQVSSNDSVANWGMPKTFSTEVAQKMLLLREMGDLIILDTLLNQQDRFGNLHYRNYYVKMEEDGSLDWKLVKLVKNSKGKKVPDAAQAGELGPQGYIRVRRMLLADNDCGVAKQNKMAAVGMAQKIAHLHPDSYAAVQNLQRLSEAGILSSYLKEDLLFTNADVKSVEANLASMATAFKKKCLAGALRLDADLAQWLGKKPSLDSAAFCSAL